MSSRRDSWELAEGDALTSELTALRLLGGGSVYEAYLAFDEVTWSPVVVKVVRPAQVEDSSSLRGLRREVAALEAVNHPALVRGLRAELDGPRPHVVLENLDGPRLSSLIRRHGRLEPQQYLPTAIEVAAALHYIHRVGYVHLDVKPSNIIMGAPAKLIDLSVARPLEQAVRLDHAVGTDAYMAPEQCAPPATGTPGPASDVWGLGTSLFHAVAGYRPFVDVGPDTDHPRDRYPQLDDDPRPLPDGVPPTVATVLRACLERNPDDRPLPSEIAEELGPVLAGQPRGRLAGLKPR